METKTKIHAEDGKHDLVITRDFDLPIHLLFKAFTEAEIVAEWMSTNVLELDCKKRGGYRFETTDPKGNKHYFSGAIHECEPETLIVRTFEMENTPFPVQLEFLQFESLTDETSRLTMQIVYKSGYDRDEMLKLPFAFGINMAHNRLEEIVQQLKLQ